MLAIGRALMSNPRLLLLDEPSMGLAPVLVNQILVTLSSLRKDGVTILLVEQNVAAALAITDRALCWKPAASCSTATPPISPGTRACGTRIWECDRLFCTLPKRGLRVPGILARGSHAQCRARDQGSRFLRA
jgi:ABC-type taurine transport system ATPase subunit